MEEGIKINSSLSEEELYKSLFPQVERLLSPDEPIISNLANITAVLKETFSKINWVGFYFLVGEKLFLGPFQGKLACTIIEISKGVCGNAVSRKETIIVEDVGKFPGHIACDSGSRSEIVIPLIKEEKVFGVLDLDSYQLSAFNYTDKIYLEKLCKLIVEKLNFTFIDWIVK